MPKRCRLWKADKRDLARMIARRIRLGEVNDTFRAMEAGEVIRSVVDFG